MQGSVRQRSIGSFELRVFTGVDPNTGKRCCRSKTVRGNRAEAECELVAMVDVVGRGPGVAARTTAGELLERWFAIAETGWAPTTIRQTRSVLDRYLHPHLGAGLVADLTTLGASNMTDVTEGELFNFDAPRLRWTPAHNVRRITTSASPCQRSTDRRLWRPHDVRKSGR